MNTFEIISDYPLYRVSKDGRIIKNNNGKLLHPSRKPNGYCQVNLCTNDGKRKKEYVHRIVATTFIPNVNNYPEVNHIDGVRDNNNLSNLEWVTHKENVEKARFLNKSIRVINSKGIVVGIYFNIQTACSKLGLTQSNVSACLHNSRQRTHRGYTFQFVN